MKHKISEKARMAGQAARQKNAEEANKPLREIAMQLRAQGQCAMRIANIMNQMGLRTRRGKFFSCTTIKRLINE